MVLDWLDWLLIGIFLLITIFIGFRCSGRAGKSLAEFFLGGRQFPWYIAGFSMVATTFAADTPLAVTELVANNGIAGNWLWWNMLAGGLLATFFFARLWRRAEILTDVELVELRYGGKPAAFLRGFKAIYLGLFMNAIIIAWVNLALMTLIKIFFNVPDEDLIWYVGGAMLFVALYSSLSGLWGIAINDFIQFSIAITGSVVLAVIVIGSEQIGGISGLKEQVPEDAFNFFPQLGTGEIAGSLGLGVASFIAFMGMQWWASWYPGSEPGGGGYIAQRMMSTKTEKDSLYATLFFQVAHFCIRSWPWILVGLAVIVLYPELAPEAKREGYAMAMRDFLPSGLRGLLLVTFLSAYMSTISTQLNWGTSYLINDFWKRFFYKKSFNATEDEENRQQVLAGRIGTLLLMVFALFVTTQLDTITQAWEFILQGSAGIGLVLILRWYWWRINAWSEIAATVGPLLVFGSIKLIDYVLQAPFRVEYPEAIPAAVLEAHYAAHPLLAFPYSFFITIIISTIIWLVITFITKPESSHTLESFYQRVAPGGWWEPVQKKLGLESKMGSLGYLALSWLFALILIYSVLFATGKFILQEYAEGLIFLLIIIVSFFMFRLVYKRS